jgi:multiple sugar transport system substrate-binding protein
MLSLRRERQDTDAYGVFSVRGAVRGAKATRRTGLRAGALLAASGVGTASAACGQGEPPVPAGSASQPVTVEYLYSLGGALGNLMEASVDAFRRTHPNITLQATNHAGQQPAIQDKALSMLAAGTAPDVLHFTPKEMSAYSSVDALLSLDPLITKSKSLNIKDILPAAVQYNQQNGKTYGLPFLLSSTILVYNRGLFQKAGAKTPDQYEKEGKWTWETCLDVAKQLTSGAGEERTYGMYTQLPIHSMDFAFSWMWSMGGEFWDKDMKRLLLTQPASIDAVQFFGDFGYRHRVEPLPGDPPVAGSFLSNRMAMQFGARIGFAGFLDRAQFPLGIAPIPKGVGGRQVRGTTHSSAVMKPSKQQEAAFEVVSFLTLPETHKLWIGWPGGEPMRKSVADGGTFEKGLQEWEDVGVYQEAIRNLRGHQLPLKSTEMDVHWKEVQRAVWVGERSAADAIRAVAAPMQALLTATSP